MKTQTAVEWLMEHITYDNNYGQRWVSFKETTDLNIYFQKAKEMEKEQISQAYTTGVEEDVYNNPLRTGEMYYNETFEQ